MKLLGKIKKNANRKGFTLVEVVVVLVIIAILIALAVPSVMKYIDDANEVKDDVKVSYLNKATEGYRVHLYADNKLKEDIFYAYGNEKDMQKALMDAEWIDEYQTALADDTNYFHWNRDSQRWEKKASNGGGGSGDKPVTPEDKTILGDTGKGVDKGNWAASTGYKYNDLVTSNGRVFKCIVPEGTSFTSRYDPGSDKGSYDTVWKEIKLEFDMYNLYETNDIITYENSYYKATGFDSSNNARAYIDASSNPMWQAKDIIKNLFTKVVWDEEKKDFVVAP